MRGVLTHYVSIPIVSGHSPAFDFSFIYIFISGCYPTILWRFPVYWLWCPSARKIWTFYVTGRYQSLISVSESVSGSNELYILDIHRSSQAASLGMTTNHVGHQITMAAIRVWCPKPWLPALNPDTSWKGTKPTEGYVLTRCTSPMYNWVAGYDALYIALLCTAHFNPMMHLKHLPEAPKQCLNWTMITFLWAGNAAKFDSGV